MITGIEEIVEIIILKCQNGKYEITSRIDMVEQEMTNVCKKLYFDVNARDSLLFVDTDCIIQYNFDQKFKKNLYDIDDFQEQPDFFLFNEDQTVCIVASEAETRLLKFKQGKGIIDEIDMLKRYGISEVKNVIYYEKTKTFYVMSNRRHGMLGMYLCRILDSVSSRDPPITSSNFNETFILNQGNKLDIGQVDMYIYEDELTNSPQLILAYKTIYVNTYTVNVIDIDTKDDDGAEASMLFRHESFCLWETNIMSFLNPSTIDLVTLSTKGMIVTDLSSGQQSRSLFDNKRHELKLHSLASSGYLELDDSNHILYKCT